jgi:hypothetical protein
MLPPGLRSQQAGTMIPTLMLIPPAMPPQGESASSSSTTKDMKSRKGFAVSEKRKSHV